MMKTLKDNQPNYKGVKHEYMKNADINNFSTYTKMIEGKF